MTIFSKFKELVNNAGKRVLKLKGIGGSATTAKEAMPFGFDGNPIADITAVYTTTTNASERVVQGYINRWQSVATGETRMYSVDVNKDMISAYVWCHSNGIVSLNGETYTSVRYEPLNTELANMVTQINTQLTAIAAGITAAGGTYTPTPVTLNISTAQSQTVKLK